MSGNSSERRAAERERKRLAREAEKERQREKERLERLYWPEHEVYPRFDPEVAERMRPR
jgi:hypothetical protein